MAAALYNPLEKLNLAKSIEGEILSRPVSPLGELLSFFGAGVYAIYCAGAFPAYAPLKLANAKSWAKPIYVGKAIQKGGRKGGLGLDNVGVSTAIYSRLRKHADSIVATQNLSISDFVYRSIELDDIWIPLGENILIETFKPLWNLVVEGFGINDPGKGRQDQKRSAWDILHPGREYASRLRGGSHGSDAILGRVDDYFHDRALRPLPKSVSKSE